MIEGWLDEEYLVFFDASEIVGASERYAIERWLPGHQVIGLRGWDNLLVKDKSAQVFSVPCVPLSFEHASPFALPSGRLTLSQDSRFVGKIKWYVQPLVFGGDPATKGNMSWVSHELHGQLVAWWNERYVRSKARGAEA